MEELGQLKSIYGVTPTIYFHRNCPITTSMDIEVNREMQKTNGHGTTGLGFGQTLQRESELFHFHLEDLFFGKDILEQKLIAVYHKYYGAALEDSLYEYIKKHIKEIYEPFIELFDSANVMMVDDESFLLNGPSIVFEGSQGLLLDKHTGFFPHVTRSHTNETNVKRFMKPDDTLRMHYVLRAYLTKHGDGFLLNEDKPNTIIVDDNESNKPNDNQGEFRRAYLSLPYLKYALVKNMDSVINGKVTSLNFYVNCLDHLKDFCLYDDNNNLVEFKTEKEFLAFLTEYVWKLYVEYSIPIHFYTSNTPYSEYTEY